MTHKHTSIGSERDLTKNQIQPSVYRRAAIATAMVAEEQVTAGRNGSRSRYPDDDTVGPRVRFAAGAKLCVNVRPAT